MNNKAKEVGRWTLVRNQYELTEFEVHHSISYRRVPPSFPCFVSEIIASDECSETDLLTKSDITEMFGMLHVSNKRK